MIFDYIDQYLNYSALFPKFKEAFEFALSLKDRAVGRYENGNYFAIVQEGITTPISVGEFESHQNYIDVQIVVSGSEVVEWETIDHLTQSQSYDSLQDIAFYIGKGQSLTVKQDMFYVMYPQDGHKPLKYYDFPTAYKKIVLKVKV